MKKIFKSRIFFLILGMIITTTIGVTASVLYNASEIGFTPSDPNWKVNNLNDAIHDLYKGKSTAVQVATLTTPGATYTMQNDGYILGTARHDSSGRMPRLYVDNDIYPLGNWKDDDVNTYPVSMYVTKNKVVKTRPETGIYNLIVYEWK